MSRSTVSQAPYTSAFEFDSAIISLERDIEDFYPPAGITVFESIQPLCGSVHIEVISSRVIFWDEISCLNNNCLDNYCLNCYCENMEVIAAKAQTKVKSPRFDSPQQEAYLALWRTYDRLRALEDELFSNFELTAQQYNLLRLLQAAQKPLPTLTLAERLISRAPDVTRMIDKLEGRGVITRTRSTKDRREVLVEITTAGLKLLDRIAGPLKLCHHRQLGHLSNGDLKTLIGLLQVARAPHEPDESAWR